MTFNRGELNSIGDTHIRRLPLTVAQQYAFSYVAFMSAEDMADFVL